MGFPEEHNLSIYTTAYNNWEDNLILISYFKVRSEANLFYTVKSKCRLWYLQVGCTRENHYLVGQNGTCTRLPPTSTCHISLVNTTPLQIMTTVPFPNKYTTRFWKVAHPPLYFQCTTGWSQVVADKIFPP